ncbi:MAG: serine--tRNA ligase [Myxococcota bacterium]
MLDIRHVAAHPQEVARNCEIRNMPADVEALVALYRERNAKLTELENVRADSNAVAKSMQGKMTPEERQQKIEQGRALKLRVAELEAVVGEIDPRLDTWLRTLPNLTHPDVPVGNTDDDHRELRKVGTPRPFDFQPKDHVQLGQDLDLIDFEAGARVAGQKFYFLKNEAVLLDLALQRFAIDRLMAHGYMPVVTPDLARPDILEGIGFNPRGAESQVYSIAGHDLCLVGTAEITIGGMLRDTILDPEKLPIRIAGISHCFRTEAGAGGRESKGLYRVHQFTKVEMFIFCGSGTADDGRMESEHFHDELLAIEEELFTALEIPYRVIDVCSGDLGAPAFRKFDIEAWMPGRQGGSYGEVTSTSNCTDYQSRRLGIRAYGPDGGKPRAVHTLNGTAIALSRGIIAVLENHQQADGSIAIPKALRPYLPFEQIGPK